MSLGLDGLGWIAALIWACTKSEAAELANSTSPRRVGFR